MHLVTSITVDFSVPVFSDTPGTFGFWWVGGFGGCDGGLDGRGRLVGVLRNKSSASLGDLTEVCEVTVGEVDCVEVVLIWLLFCYDRKESVGEGSEVIESFDFGGSVYYTAG